MSTIIKHKEFPKFKSWTMDLCGRPLTIEVGKVAELASASAMVKIAVNGQSEMSAAEGLGPVDALDKAMRRALTVFYPSIAQMRLTDFKVRVLDSSMATASQVRVLVESTDGVSFWSTTGVSTDIIKASTTALVDSMVYKLYRDDKAADR